MLVAADVLDSDATWAWVRDSPAVTAREVIDGPAGEAAEEDAL